tara:strand:- start:1655 stop:2038 length:384 start_codon:yes stop_codon:yes gene_type:complete
MSKVHLLNTAIIPSFTGLFRVYGGSYTVEQARAALRTRGQGIGEDFDGPEPVEVVSHVGHQSTSDMMSTMLGRPIEMSRAPWDGTGFAIVCQLAFRGEEGRVYSVEEMAEFEARGLVTWRWMEIVRG